MLTSQRLSRLHKVFVSQAQHLWLIYDNIELRADTLTDVGWHGIKIKMVTDQPLEEEKGEPLLRDELLAIGLAERGDASDVVGRGSLQVVDLLPREASKVI